MEKYSNNATTTLNGTINSSVTSLVVTSAALFPTSGDFRIVIDSEIMKVTAVSGTTFTIERGLEDTTAASHTNGATISHIITADSLDQWRGDLLGFGAGAYRPAAGIKGRHFFDTDGPHRHFDDGSAWYTYGPSWLMTPHDDSGFSWVRQASGATTLANGLMHSLYVPTGDTDFSIRSKSKSGTYTITMGCNVTHGNGIAFGFGPRDSGTGKFIFFGHSWNGAMRIIKMNTATSYNSDYADSALNDGQDFTWASRHLLWLQFEADSSNFHFRSSYDGFNFITWATKSKTDFLATHDSFIYGAVANSYGSYFNILSWVEQ